MTLDLTDVPPILTVEQFEEFKNKLPARIQIKYRFPVTIPTKDGCETYIMRELTDDEFSSFVESGLVDV